MRNLSRAEHLAAWLCGAGLLLGLGGLWAMRHVPMTPEEEENERRLQKVQTVVKEAARDKPDDPTIQLMLAELEKESVYHRRPPPYRTAGIVCFSLGVTAFIAGVLVWFGKSGRWRPSRWIKANEDV